MSDTKEVKDREYTGMVKTIDSAGNWNPKGGEQFVHSALVDHFTDPDQVDTSGDRQILEILRRAADLRQTGTNEGVTLALDSDEVFDLLASEVARLSPAEIPPQNDRVDVDNEGHVLIDRRTAPAADD